MGLGLGPGGMGLRRICYVLIYEEFAQRVAFLRVPMCYVLCGMCYVLCRDALFFDIDLGARGLLLGARGLGLGLVA